MAAAALLMLLAADAGAQRQSLQLNIVVVRSCAVQTAGAGMTTAAVTVTCSRGNAAVATTITGNTAPRVVALPARQATVVATHTTLATARGRDAARLAAGVPSAAHQLVTLNF